MTDTMPTTDPMSADNRSMIGRDEIDDLESILAVTNTDRDEVVHHVQNHAETIYTWNYDKGERPALNKLYEKAKKAGHGIDRPDFEQPERPMSAIGG